MNLGIKFFIAILSILCVFFTIIGLYEFDFSLLLIGALFATSITLVALEVHNEAINPFKRS